MLKSGPTILAIETARDACGVAVLRPDGRAASATTLRARSHAEQLVPMAVRTIEEAGLEFRGIDAIAVSAGPGSYTGLRIGVSTAKGFASAYGARLIGVPTLQAYALSIARSCTLYGQDVDLIAVALHARQTELYFGLFEAGTSGATPSALVESCVVTVDEAAGRLAEADSGRIIRIGGDAAGTLVQAAADTTDTYEAHFVPGAMSVGLIGLERLLQGHFEDPGSFEPRYLKDYVARHGGSMFERLSV